MTRTVRIQALLDALRSRGYWTADEHREIEEITDMGRDPSYIPEGTEDWMEEDGVPRSYDKPPRVPRLDIVDDRPALARQDFTPGQHVELSLTPKPLDPPPMRPAERKELEKSGLVTMGADGVAVPVEVDARIKTLEATVTDMMRRLKALEERVIDPSV